MRIPRPSAIVLHAEAWVVLVAVRAALKLGSFQRTLGLVRRLKGRAHALDCNPKPVIARVVAAVMRCSRAVPGGKNCLVQALAADLLLSRRGVTSAVRIGVAKDGHGAFRAHAWAEAGGETVIGGAADLEFTPLPPLGGSRGARTL